jgi:citrate lyase subunit beta / citryl-CoA lyase
MSGARSWLFVPGDSERKQAKALGGPADAIILDLEDSVAAAQLPAARERVASVLGARKPGLAQQLWVRVNPPSTRLFAQDLAAVLAAEPDGLVLPKVSSAEEIGQVALALGPQSAIRLLVIATETPSALLTLAHWNLASVAGRLTGLTWGMEDLGTAIGALGKREADGSLAFTFQLARSTCLLAAAAAGVQAVDSIYADFRNGDGLAREAAQARRDGFTGKLAIHPDQVAPINAAFTPTSGEVEWARKVIAAFAADPQAGVTSLDGQMLDRPHLVQAERLIALAQREAGAT